MEVAPPLLPVRGAVLIGLPSAGDYEVSIKFNDEHIPDSPFVVPVASLSDDARRLTVTSLQVCVWGRGPSATWKEGRVRDGRPMWPGAQRRPDRHAVSPRVCTVRRPLAPFHCPQGWSVPHTARWPQVLAGGC